MAWIFTKVGFFSVVAQAKRGRVLQVRARIRADLDELRKTYAPKLGPTVEGGGTDYPYRAVIGRADFAKVMERVAKDIDYTNFKDTVRLRQGAKRSELYHWVWQLMQGATRLEESASRATQRLGAPDPVEKDECRSCLGYGYFRPDGTPTIDRRERKCADCSGSGKRSTRG